MAIKKKKPAYIPKEYQPVDNIDRTTYSDEEIENAKQAVAEQSKQVKELSRLSVIWTCVSTIYAIVSTSLLISRNWVNSTVSYVLIGILALYVAIFIGAAVAAIISPKAGKKSLKGLKTAIGMLKPAMSVVLVALSIAQIVGVSGDAFTISKLPFMIFSILVPFLQVAFKFALFVVKARTKRISRTYRVRVERYVNGKRTKKSVKAKFKEKRYKTK